MKTQKITNFESVAKDRDIAKDPAVYQQLYETAHFQDQMARKSQNEELWESRTGTKGKKTLRH